MCRQVNERLQAMEATGVGGDPAYPKQQVCSKHPHASCPRSIQPSVPGVLQWPTAELCPLCRLPALEGDAGISWNRDKVYRFLLRFYQGSSPEASLQGGAADSGAAFASRHAPLLRNSLLRAMHTGCRAAGVQHQCHRVRLHAQLHGQA